MTTSHRRRGVMLLAALSLIVAACGSDDAADDAAADSTTTVADAATASDDVTVTAADFEYKGLPETISAGSKLSLTNSSKKEIHELVADKLPEDEERSADELIKLPREEFEKLFSGPPAVVLIAPPDGKPQIAALGDGTLKDPGRYLVLCAIPTGADPAEFLKAVQESKDGPPDVAGGPPHFTQGMYAEITVE